MSKDNQQPANDKLINKFKHAVNKIKHALIPEQYKLGELSDAIVDSVRIKIVEPGLNLTTRYLTLEEISQKDLVDQYLQEVSQGKYIKDSVEYEVLLMSPEELKDSKLTYDEMTKSLLDSQGRKASTIGKESKSMRDVQVFVMSKEGDIYIGTHEDKYSTDKKTLVHGSFLSFKPAETAGVIGINESGKIVYISDDSGHYQPEAIDMYRGIKKIQEIMPGALDKNCKIHLHSKKELIPVSDFIAFMEAIPSEKTNKTRYKILHEERVAKIKEYHNRLKNTSKTNVLERATKLGHKLKRTQNDQNAAKKIVVKTREVKKARMTK